MKIKDRTYNVSQKHEKVIIYFLELPAKCKTRISSLDEGVSL
jgi:hypothetical protein